MQGINFRQYIRNNFFDLDLFAGDLAHAIYMDGGSVTAEDIKDCFSTAQTVGWAEDGEHYSTNTTEGCFGLYSHALGLIGTKACAKDHEAENQFHLDDAWVDHDWPTVEPVVAHLNSQLVKGLVHTDFDYEGIPVNDDAQSFIDAALDKTPATKPEPATVLKLF